MLPLYHGQFSHKYSQKYGMSFLDPTSDWYSASVSVIIHVISYNIGQCYNNTRLYSHFSDVIISVMFSQITSVTIGVNRLFRHKSNSKKTSKLRVTDLCEGNSLVTSEFPTQRASKVEKVSIWWHHHGSCWLRALYMPPCCVYTNDNDISAVISNTINSINI